MRRQLFFESMTHRQLTPRETSVLSAAKKHEPVSDIASSLHIPQSIVIRHLSNIILKLNESDQSLAHQLVFAYKIPTQD
jgi:DNA-binding NarL/FixJ family response regulator